MIFLRLNYTWLALLPFSQFSAAVVPHKANDDVALGNRGLITIPHCLEWYKLKLRPTLLTPAVQYLVRKSKVTQ